jgi:hypothetical protein
MINAQKAAEISKKNEKNKEEKREREWITKRSSVVRELEESIKKAIDRGDRECITSIHLNGGEIEWLNTLGYERRPNGNSSQTIISW